MFLRNGKNTDERYTYDDLCISNISYIYYWYSTKGEFTQHKNIKNVIRCVCDMYYIAFTHNARVYYGKTLNISFEADYTLTINKLNGKNKRIDTHILHIEHLVKTFLFSSYFRGEHKRISYYDAIIVVFAIAFHYFHMVIIETLYNDCLTWSRVSELLGDYEYSCENVANENERVVSLSKKLYGVLWKDIAFSDHDTCAYIRQYMLSL